MARRGLIITPGAAEQKPQARVIGRTVTPREDPMASGRPPRGLVNAQGAPVGGRRRGLVNAGGQPFRKGLSPAERERRTQQGDAEVQCSRCGHVVFRSEMRTIKGTDENGVSRAFDICKVCHQEAYRNPYTDQERWEPLAPGADVRFVDDKRVIKSGHRERRVVVAKPVLDNRDGLAASRAGEYYRDEREAPDFLG